MKHEVEPDAGNLDSHDALDALANGINVLIESIRDYIRIGEPENLLMAVHDIFNYGNPSIEGNGLVFHPSEMPLRPVEYLQSLIAAQEDKLLEQTDKKQIGTLAHKFLKDYEDLFKKSMCYVFRLCQLEQKSSNAAQENMLAEAQFLHMVRGNRYQFLERQYFEPLLSIHSAEFEKLFSISANNVIEGFCKLESALSNGRLNAFLKLRKMIDSLPTYFNFELDDLDEDYSKNAQIACEDAFSVNHFNVARATGWPKSFIDSLSYQPGEAVFRNCEEMTYWPIMTLPIHNRPFITLGEATYCFDYYTLVDYFYRAVQKAVLRLDPGYKQTWQKLQKTASENMVKDVLIGLFDDGDVYADNYYGTKKHRKENDILIQYHDALIVVEVKAGQFTDAPPISNFDSYIKYYRSLIEESNNQCSRFRSFINDCDDELVLYDSSNAVKSKVDLTGISNVFCLSVTIDNINSYAARADRLKFLKLNEGVACMAVDDLMTYVAYFDNPLEFLHFLKQRELASLNSKIALNDELDHLGMYIAHNMYSKQFEGEYKFDEIIVSGYREKLDAFFTTIGTPIPTPEKPHQNMPFRFKEIIDVLHKTGVANCVEASVFLLNFSSDARTELANGIENALSHQSTTRRQVVLSFGGAGDSIRMSCFLQQGCLGDAMDDDAMRRYVAGILLANYEKQRAYFVLSYDKNLVLISVKFVILDCESVPEKEREILLDEGRKRTDFWVKKHIERQGKIGRNELCPCGSGKKYKKCHGR